MSTIETKTPREWGAAKGHIHAARTKWQSPEVDWRYAAAETLHGWREHEHHAGAPIQLAEEDYDGAIEAVSAPVGNPTPYLPAESQYSPHRKG